MQIDRIGFGYVKNLGNYENCKVWLEAKLEDWEDPSESLNILRSKVAEELNLPDKWFDLKGKLSKQLQALEATNAAVAVAEENLKKARQNWEDFAQSLIARGINAELIDKNPLEAIKEVIGRQIDEATEYILPTLQEDSKQVVHEEHTEQEDPLPLNEDAGSKDDYFDPYYDRENDEQDDYWEQTYLVNEKDTLTAGF
jgi:hypothetical protein